MFEKQRLLADNVENISQSNKANRILIDTNAILGKWSDEDGNYIYCFKEGDTFYVDSNILETSDNEEITFKFEYGIYFRIRKVIRIIYRK